MVIPMFLIEGVDSQHFRTVESGGRVGDPPVQPDESVSLLQRQPPLHSRHLLHRVLHLLSRYVIKPNYYNVVKLTSLHVVAIRGYNIPNLMHQFTSTRCFTKLLGVFTRVDNFFVGRFGLCNISYSEKHRHS